jgi:hypothetical protein
MALFHRKTNAKLARNQLAIAGIKELSADAPLRTYCIDIIAEELFAKSETTGWLNAFIREVRKGINSAGISALEMNRDRLKHPERFFRTKRFIEDIKRMQKLIERNKKVDRVDLQRETKRVLNRIDLPPVIRVRPERAHVDEIDALLAALPGAADAIAVFLKRYKLQVRGGNHDPVTRVFIDKVFDLWRELYWTEASADENRLFNRLLVAAWRDLNFPTREVEGQSLEHWLADRVRKQFPDGICRTRLSEQYEEILRAFERS